MLLRSTKCWLVTAAAIKVCYIDMSSSLDHNNQ